MTRRGALLLALLAVPAAAEQAPPQRPRPPRPPPRERTDNRPRPNDGAYMGGGMVVTQPELVPRGDLAPRPNLGMEAPRAPVRPEPEFRVSPGMINPRIPGGGSAARGTAPSRMEERLFEPAPGAHIRLPMTW